MRLKNKQVGVVLVTSLLFILVLSLLVVSAVSSAVLQQKMSANFRSRDLAFQSAETTLKAGENYLQKTDPLPTFDGTNGRYNFNNAKTFEKDSDWSSLSTVNFQHSMHQVLKRPKYLIEKLQLIDTVGESLDVSMPITSNYYRVTSRSDNINATVVLQSIYRR
jgi:type IV pilus assembly protein PilX